MNHANISIFVPHVGCPNQCSFCNQAHITGVHRLPGTKDIVNAVAVAEKSLKAELKNAEIAFFGGSFTAIDREYMLTLLEAAFEFVKSGKVKGIRISTRPDAIDDEILNLLKSYGVTSIELGAQSMRDEVLALNFRGHTSEDVKIASGLIKKYGFELGLQMMTGLYGDDDEGAVYTCTELIKLQPGTVRIYPTIVLKNTYLEQLYKSGKYRVQDLEHAVDLCARLLYMFYNANISVIRLGLHSIESDSYVAGPWHPAFRELCEGKIYLDRAVGLLKSKGKGRYTLYVRPEDVSKMVGHKRKNINALKAMGFECKVASDPRLAKYEIIAKKDVD